MQPGNLSQNILQQMQLIKYNSHYLLKFLRFSGPGSHIEGVTEERSLSPVLLYKYNIARFETFIVLSYKLYQKKLISIKIKKLRY
jgi:hypothetical protein